MGATHRHAGRRRRSRGRRMGRGPDACRQARGRAGLTMAFLIDRETRIVVQGLTGATGRLGAEMMEAGGATIVAGVTPGKGGSAVGAIPVFDTVEEAKLAGGTASILFVPAGLLRDAALEAIDAGMDPIVL